MSSLLSLSKLAFSVSPRMMPSSITMAARGYATKKLFIGNIAWGTTDAQVHEHFQQYGAVTDLYCPKDDEGRTKGFGFVEMEEEDCNKVIEEVNGRPFNGRDLRVQFAQEKENRGQDRRRQPRENRIRDDGSGVYRPRGGDGERQFRPRRDGGERQFRPRGGDDGERQFRPRRDGGERQFRPRRWEKNNSDESQ